jgi:glycosyltransferase A (GT-A) superfamily protein (DUF2064 family)
MIARRAILLFTRSIESEIKAKRFRGLSYLQHQRLYHRLIAHTIDVAQRTQAELLIAADKPAPEFSSATHFLLQRGQNFNERLQHALADAFALGYDEVLVIGNDTPELCSTLLEQAFSDLAQHPFVFGNSLDGGVYLIGLRRTALPHFGTLCNTCRWHTSFVQQDLHQAIATLGGSAAWLPPLTDLDRIADVLHIARRHVSCALMLLVFLQFIQHSLFYLTHICVPCSAERLHLPLKHAPPVLLS